MPRSKKTQRKFPAPHLRSAEIISDFQKIHPFLHSHVAFVLQRLSILLAFLGIIIGNTTLVGFFLRNQLKIDTLNFFITRPSIALSIFLLSLGILFAMTRRKNIIVSLIVYILASASLGLGILSLLSLTKLVQHSIYPLLPSFNSHALNTFFNAAANASLITSFFSLALLLLQRRTTIFVSQACTILGLLILFPTIIGFIYGSSFIYSVSTSTRLAPITTIGLCALGISLLFARASQGIMRGLTNQSTGGFFARRFIFLAVSAPIVLGWIVLGGYNLHWYNSEVRFLLLITFSILTLLIWAIFIARSLHSLDVTRRYIQDNIIFLSEASKILSSSLEYRKNLRKLSDLGVTQFADICSIAMKTPEGELQRLAIAYKNSRKTPWIQSTKRRKQVEELLHTKEMTTAIRTGKSKLFTTLTESDIHVLSPQSKNFFSHAKTFSIIIVPLTVQHHPIGILQFVSTDPYHPYSTSELQIAEELASRASLAIENARLYRNAREAIRVRDEFMSIASHELRTPLTSLKVYTEVLLHNFVGKDKKTATYLQKMDGQIINLTNLIKDLLDVSRIQVGKLAFHFEKVNLESIARTVVENFQLTSLNHEILVEGHITHPIIGDNDRLGQVILNLLTNAVKYSPQAKRVVVSLTQNETTVGIAIQDFGIGIERKHLQKIFNRFYQVNNQHRSNVGLGMGLYISSEIIKRHGGSILAQSTKGKGSIFSFTIPVKQPKLSS